MNISDIKDCYGCGLCAAICGKKIIDIHLNEDGFFEPYIAKHDLCTNCGLCIDTCSFVNDDVCQESSVLHSYGAWSLDEIVRSQSSSGGISYMLGKYLLSKGYKVIGVRYNATDQVACHFIATDENELKESLKSKYIQSYTLDAFRKIDRNSKYLVIGMPCQIDSFRRFIRRLKIEDNFVLVDFFCHGVPSYNLWNKYLSYQKGLKEKFEKVEWRNKTNGWHDSYSMRFFNHQGNVVKTSKLSEGDIFLRFFLNDSCLSPACYDRCKFKFDHSSADIRIGDAWGSEYAHDDKGVSVAAAFTQKGDDILHQCDIVLEDKPFEVLAKAQMRYNAKRPKVYKKIRNLLKDEDSSIMSLVTTMNAYEKQRVWVYRINQLLFHPLLAVKKIIGKLHK